MKKYFNGIFIATGFLIIGLGVGYFYGSPKEIKVADPASNLHYSTYSQQDFFEEVFRNAKVVQTKKGIVGLIVNHHLLAPHLIAQAFNLAQTKEKQTIVILSPNHFGVGAGQVLTSEWSWATPYGELKPDEKTITSLISSGLVNVDERPFEKEHGIANIVAFVKKAIPNAQIVPLIFRDSLSSQKASELAQVLNDILPADALVVGSLDFSHKKTSEVADLEDEKSLEAINNFDYQKIQQLDVDSKPVLSCLLHYFALKNAMKFNLLAHTNSAKILNKPDSLETTSYITGYFTSGK